MGAGKPQQSLFLPFKNRNFTHPEEGLPSIPRIFFPSVPSISRLCIAAVPSPERQSRRSTAPFHKEAQNYPRARRFPGQHLHLPVTRMENVLFAKGPFPWKINLGFVCSPIPWEFLEPLPSINRVGKGNNWDSSVSINPNPKSKKEGKNSTLSFVNSGNAWNGSTFQVTRILLGLGNVPTFPWKRVFSPRIFLAGVRHSPSLRENIRELPGPFSTEKLGEKGSLSLFLHCFPNFLSPFCREGREDLSIASREDLG